MNRIELQDRFQPLVEQHYGILHTVSHSYCRNWDDREDLTQEIIVQLWRSFPKFDGRCRFSTWMYRIALNVAISFYRRENSRTRRLLSADDHVWDTVCQAPGRPEDLALLHHRIHQFDPLNKALALLYLDGNSYAEIAKVLGISETNVATKISRLKEALKRGALQTTQESERGRP